MRVPALLLAVVVMAATVVAASGGGVAAANGSHGEPGIDLVLRDSVADSDYTYLASATDVEVVVHEGRTLAVVASADESVHLLDVSDPSSINELRHPNRQQQSGNNNFNNAIGGESVTSYVANDGELYFVLAWSNSDAIQTFHIHENGRLDELSHVVDSSKMNLASDLFVYKVGDKQYAAVIGKLSNSLRIVDVTDPRGLGNAALKDSITDGGDLELDGASGVAHYPTGGRHYAVVVSIEDDGVQIIDVTDPDDITAADHLSDTDQLELDGADEVDIYRVGGRNFAAVTGNSDDGVQIIDITDPHNIFPTARVADSGSLRLDNPRGVAVHTIGGRHYAAVASQADDGVQIIDITNPYNPVPKANIGDTNSAELDGAFGIDTFTIGNRHYAIVASTDDNGVQIVEMTAVTADAGDGQSARTGSAVVLDGSGSAVSSGETPTYQWTQTAGPTVTLSSATAQRPSFTAPATPSTLVFTLTATHGSASSTDTVAVSVSADPNAEVSVGKTAVDLALRDSVADGDYTYLSGAIQVEAFAHEGRMLAVVASANESVHLLDVSDPSSINELRHPNRQQQSGNNNFNNAVGGESVTSYVANDGELYFVLAWSNSDAIQTFHIHENGRLDELSHVVDSSKMDFASDLFVYRVGDKQYAAVSGVLSSSLRIVDVTDPRGLGNAALKDSITDGGDLELEGASAVAHYPTGGRHYAVVVSEIDDGVQIIDVTDPDDITAADHLSDTDQLELKGPQSVDIYRVGGRNFAVVTGNSDDGVQIIDITDPHNIFPTARVADSGSLRLDNPGHVAVHTIGGRHYAAVASSGDDGVQIIDITNPYNPVPKANIGDTNSARLDDATGIDTFTIGNRHYAIVASNIDHGVQIVEMTAVTADAGGDLTVPGRIDKITLDGSRSAVSSGETPTYQWTQTAGPPVTLSSATAQQPNFVPPAAPQTLSFQLAVSHGSSQAVDTVTITLEEDPSTDTGTYGGKLVSDSVKEETLDDPINGGTSQYLTMHFSDEGENQTFTYNLLEALSGSTTVTVTFMTATLGPQFGAPGYTWDREAVSIFPQTLTFTSANWYKPQVVAITSLDDSDNTPEQAIIVITSTLPGSYSGVHITVDDGSDDGSQSGVGGQGSPGTEGEQGALERPGDSEPNRPNNAPTVASAIADVGPLLVGGDATVDLSGVFADADGDRLTITAESSDDDVSVGLIQHTPSPEIWVLATGRGTAELTVTANDENGGIVTDTFTVTVEEAPAAQQQQPQQYQGGSADDEGDDQGDDPPADEEPLPEEFTPPTDEHVVEEQIVLTPGAVSDLTLTATNNSGVQVSWTAPTDGTAPTRYIVHLKPEGGDHGSGKTKRPKANKTQVTFKNLEPGTTYQVWVRAQNALGKGERTHATITLPAPQP